MKETRQRKKSENGNHKRKRKAGNQKEKREQKQELGGKKGRRAG